MKNKAIEFKLPMKNKLLFILMGSFCIGILIANFLGYDYFNRIGVITEYFIEKYKYNDINSLQLFNYILEKRIAIIIVIWFMGFTVISRILNRVYLGWIGFSLGISITCLVMKFGIKGIIIFAGAMFPHFIFYVFAILMLVYKCENIFYNLKVYGKNNKIILEYILVFIICAIVMIIGIILESFVNPIILKGILS